MIQIKRDFIGMFDVLKGILMLLIVLVHQVGFGDVVMNFRIAAVLDSVLRYNADIMALFFLVSGYTLRREADWRAFARRQARQLLAPYFVLMVVCTGLRVMLHLCQGGFRIQDISTVVLAFLYGAVQPFELFGKVWVAAVGAFWFLPTLFVSGLLRQLLWRIEDRTRQALCLWGLVVLGVSFPSVTQIQLPWFLVQSCTALGFLEIGQQLRQKKLLFQRLPAVFTWAALACWIVMHCCSGAQIAANIWRGGAAGLPQNGPGCRQIDRPAVLYWALLSVFPVAARDGDAGVPLGPHGAPAPAEPAPAGLADILGHICDSGGLFRGRLCRDQPHPWAVWTESGPSPQLK